MIFHYMCAHNNLPYLKHLSVVLTNQSRDHLPFSSIHLMYNGQCDNGEAVTMSFLNVTGGSKKVGGASYKRNHG